MNLTRAYIAGDTSEPVPDTTVGDLLQQAAAEFPDGLALLEGAVDRDARRRWTFGELREQAEQVARALLGRFDAGEHVAVWAPNLPEWVLLQLGAGLAGMVLVPLNPAYRARELTYALEQSKAPASSSCPNSAAARWPIGSRRRSSTRPGSAARSDSPTGRTSARRHLRASDSPRSWRRTPPRFSTHLVPRARPRARSCITAGSRTTRAWSLAASAWSLATSG